MKFIEEISNYFQEINVDKYTRVCEVIFDTVLCIIAEQQFNDKNFLIKPMNYIEALENEYQIFF